MSSLSAQERISWEGGPMTRPPGPRLEYSGAAVASILPQHLGEDKGARWANSCKAPQPLSQGCKWISRRPHGRREPSSGHREELSWQTWHRTPHSAAKGVQRWDFTHTSNRTPRTHTHTSRSSQKLRPCRASGAAIIRRFHCFTQRRKSNEELQREKGSRRADGESGLHEKLLDDLVRRIILITSDRNALPTTHRRHTHNLTARNFFFFFFLPNNLIMHNSIIHF